MLSLQAMVNPYSGSTNSLSSLQSTQGGSQPNLAGLAGRAGMPPGRSPHRSSSQALDSPRNLLSAGSQHLSASQLLSLVNQVCTPVLCISWGSAAIHCCLVLIMRVQHEPGEAVCATEVGNCASTRAPVLLFRRRQTS